ncbi:hypothetical protein F0562_006265 [Nyssa sinensis]|uniref:Uncharacterized protein n=1 Tax=Nyssa sinensis TaxID=561372 RepID=A0A5J5APA6_9ASTE|nr:hypothetical protein F0562_006265 [Nyssa sinensis]
MRIGMGTTFVFWLYFVAYSVYFSSVVSADQLSFVVAQAPTLQLSPGLPVEKSPGLKPGNVVVCERVQIHGLSRLRDLRKFAHSLKVKVSHVNSSARLPDVEVCFHRNSSLELGMCPQGQWEKLVKGSWARSMSPFDHKLLDIRMADSSVATLEVSIEEELFLYRIVFLVMGIILMTLAPSLSKSLVFYYSSAMAVGVILVILIVLFQLALFLLVFIVLAGAWLGFWVVRKLVLTEDGLIDIGVSHFVAWSIRIVAAVMILQSSADPLLALEALLCGILVSSILRKVARPRFARHLYRKLCRTDNSSHRRFLIPDSSPVKNCYDGYMNNIQRPGYTVFLRSQSRPVSTAPCSTAVLGSTRTASSQLSDSDTYYSTFHDTPERRKFSKDEWENLTRDSTKKALEELVSSPDFSKWAVANAERITLTPKKDTAYQRRSWFHWMSK